MLEEFLNQVRQYKNVRIDNGYFRNGQVNKNKKIIYVWPETEKRWMKVDIKPNSLFIAMVHNEGSIALSDVLNIGIKYSLENGRNGVRVTPSEKRFDAVYFTFHKSDSFNFNSKEFKNFLSIHYKSFKKRVSIV